MCWYVEAAHLVATLLLCMFKCALAHCCSCTLLRPLFIVFPACSLIEYVKDAGRLVASRDMHVCATFARRFYWSDLNL
jgi:hypothetical protein